MTQILTKVIVGSRLHNLANERSDTDYRGVHIHDLKDVLSPFKTLKNTMWIEGDEDNTSYELADFCKLAVHGNATILEVFFSNMVVETTSVAEYMRANWQKFMDTERFVAASRGYAHNQFQKMNLFESAGIRGQERTAKFAVAYIRVMWQCAQFLHTGQFPCQIPDGAIRDLLLEIKPLTAEGLRPYIPTLTQRFLDLQRDVTDAYEHTTHRFTPDLPWIEQFIYDAYTGATK